MEARAKQTRQAKQLAGFDNDDIRRDAFALWLRGNDRAITPIHLRRAHRAVGSHFVIIGLARGQAGVRITDCRSDGEFL